MQKTNLNKWTTLNETETKSVDYLVWLYKKAVERKSLQKKRISNEGSSEICLDKISSAICWLYLRQNKTAIKTLNSYHSAKKSHQRDALASELYFKFGIRDPRDADGLVFRGIIGKPEPVTAIRGDFINASAGRLDPLSLSKQRLSLSSSNYIYIAVDLDHSIKDIRSAINLILSKEIDSKTKGGVGVRSFRLESLFLQIISFYFSGTQKREAIVLKVFGHNKRLVGTYDRSQFQAARKQFVRIAEQAPFIFFR